MIKYTVKEVKPKIFAVIIKDDYDRAMLFCRVQEYYECSDKQFRNKKFSMWDYIKWYSTKYSKRGFTYSDDWAGFNVPVDVAIKCYTKNSFSETPYDKEFTKILLSINDKLNKNDKAYILGCNNITGEVFKHEICHALWYTSKEYKKDALNLIKQLPVEHYNIFKENLLKNGYASSVIDDEIHAYLCYGYYNEKFNKGIEFTIVENYNKQFLKELKKYDK